MKRYERPRRDICYLIGRRGARLSRRQAADAWYFTARHLESLGEKDVPKFTDLLSGLNGAAIFALKLKSPST